MSRKLHIRLIAPLAAVLLAAGAAGFFLLKFVMPQHYFAWYPVVPAVFIALCLLASACMGYFNRRNPGKEAAVLLAVHGATTLLLITGLLLYFRLVGLHSGAFGITVFVFFVIYRVTEIWLYSNFERERKEAAGS